MEAIRLERFKGYENSGWVELNRPITLIFGNNSSGKSALTSSILMLKQSFEEPGYDKPFVFNSKNGIDIGSFEDAVFNHEVDFKKPMVFSFKIMVRGDYLHFSLKEKELITLSIKVAYNKKRRINTVIGLDLSRDFDDKLIISMSRKSNAFSSKFHYKSDYPMKIDENKVRMYKFIPMIFSSDENCAEEDMDINAELYQLLSDVVVDVSFFFGALVHIGPLRQEPQRNYYFTGENPSNVGRDGKDAAQILFLDKYSASTKRIMQKVNKSLKEMGYELDWDILKGGIAYLNLKETNSKIVCNLKDVGFGLSQLLPILIQGHALEESQCILLEQPEIHLHPRAQSNLGDFFIELAKSNKKFIIETHSEHLLLRIRRRIAEKKITNDFVKVLFVERINGKSVVSEIKLDKFGQYINIPDGFRDFFADDFTEVIKITEEISKRINGGEQFEGSS